MKIYAKDLLQALKKTKRTTTHVLPVLNHFLLKVKDYKTSITTTDLENTLQSECESFTDDSFSVCVPMIHKYDASNTYIPKWHKGYPFFELIKIHAETNDLLEIQYLPQTLEIKITHERSTSIIKCMDAEEFPSVN